MKQKVSVIIPVYNSEKYIAKCLESVIHQTYSAYEILVINDGSKDNSWQIMEQYAKQYPNLVKAIQQDNQGVSKTRNTAIKMAQGDYLMFIDNDDFIDKDYIQTFVEQAEQGKYDVVLGGYRRPNEQGKIVKSLTLKQEEWSKFMIFAPWARIYKKQYLIENNITFLPVNIGEDVYFNLQAMLLTDKIKIIDYMGYNWYFNSASVSNTIQKKVENLQVFELLNACYDTLKQKGILEKKEEIVETYLIRYMVWFLLFSTKKAEKQVIDDIYEKVFAWLEERFPDYRNNKNIGLTKPKGEIFSVRLIVFVFLFLHKRKMAKPFLHLYSKI